MNSPPEHLPDPGYDNHGRLLVYRLWHPRHPGDGPQTFRTYGPLFRFDPHSEQRPSVGDNAPVWYGGETFETAVREVLDRSRPAHPGRIVQVCVRQRMAALQLFDPTELLDLTDPTRLGADDDLGDRSDLDYRHTRAWARAIHSQLDCDGLRYHSAYHRTSNDTRAGINICLWNSDRPPHVVSDVNAASSGAWRRIQTMLVNLGAVPQKVHGCRRCR